jgi:uncharacterized beta-barrel protein YwiB (DUF1934 family)
VNKIKIKLQITSQDSSLHINTLGELKNNRIKFMDDEQSTHYLVLKPNVIEYYKKGEMDMKYVFDPNAITNGYYKVMNQDFTFTIKTTKFIHIKGLIDIEYALFQNNELVNQTSILLDYQPKEED